MPHEEESTPLLGPSSRLLSETKVYPLIHLIRVDITSHIDAPLTYDQLLAPDSTYTIVGPLTEKYLELRNQSVIFCLLLNKVQFMRDSQQLSISTLSLSRATLCEILAIRVLRGWSERSLQLATVLLTPWALFQGAPENVLDRAKEDGEDDLVSQGGNALEMAVVSSSKRFIRSPSCQKVIGGFMTEDMVIRGAKNLPEGIWSGRIIYSALNAHAFIADNYKKKPIQMYNPHKAPLLDHYRLKVPKVRSFLEYTNFLILFILYVVAMEGLEEDRLNWRELAFIVYALDAAAESMFRKAVATIEGVKADAVFSYQLPFNLVALAFMWPMSYILNPRWFHKVNVFMIRASSFPILLGIAVYERQTYHESTLMEQFSDVAERYVGSLPRRLKAAAGFEGLVGSRRDISAVFEIEREVGDYYREWDDDGMDDMDLLPPFTDDERGATDDAKPRDTDEPQKGSIIPPNTASPIRAAHATTAQSDDESVRRRRNSMPSRTSSPHAVAFQPGPMQRVRRNSSIHEPSPLARLFVRSPDQEAGGGHFRRGSLAFSASQPQFSSILSPTQKRFHQRANSNASAMAKPKSHLPRPSISRIDEGSRMSFIESPSSAKSGRVPFPKREASPTTVPEAEMTTPPHPHSGTIGKASDMQNKPSEEEVDDGMNERLDRIDQRQRRIEQLLEKLIGDKLGKDILDDM
ncbi:hypothetical protein P7C73_g5800, partial [Tremellales sp. Uapishka_1]